MYTVRAQPDCIRKRLSVENATHLWSLLFKSDYRLLSTFIEYVQKERQVEGIRQDEWNMFLPFIQKHGNSADTFDSACKNIRILPSRCLAIVILSFYEIPII